jgi:predicted ABC-type ATPase
MILPDDTPRLRMFAGPNGSGKSTIKSALKNEWIGVYINPDEIESTIAQTGYLDFESFSVETSEVELFNFLQASTLLAKANLLAESEKLRFQKNQIDFANVSSNSYFASVIADFIRQKLIQTKQSFSFETVMSSPDKIDLLENSHLNGYRNYLYFIATDDPRVNISRVKIRIKAGGHAVPEDKIITRYFRTLDLLWDAIKLTNRTYLFDNSGTEAKLIAKITDTENLKLLVDDIPDWFEKYVLNKRKY